MSKNKINIKKKKSSENFKFLQLTKNQYIAWACFRNIVLYFVGFTEKITDALKPLQEDVNVFTKGDRELKDLHYNDNDRIPEIVLVGNEGVVLVNNATKNFTLSK